MQVVIFCHLHILVWVVLEVYYDYVYVVNHLYCIDLLSPAQYDDKVKKIFRTNYAELSHLVSVSTNRSSIATELYSAYLISETCYDEVQDNNSNKTDIEKGSFLMRAIKSSIHIKPSLFETLIGVLENVEAFKEFAEKIKAEFYSVNTSQGQFTSEKLILN